MVNVANGQGLFINYIKPKGEIEFGFCDELLIANLKIYEINLKHITWVREVKNYTKKRYRSYSIGPWFDRSVDPQFTKIKVKKISFQLFLFFSN